MESKCLGITGTRVKTRSKPRQEKWSNKTSYGWSVRRTWYDLKDFLLWWSHTTDHPSQAQLYLHVNKTLKPCGPRAMSATGSVPSYPPVWRGIRGAGATYIFLRELCKFQACSQRQNNMSVFAWGRRNTRWICYKTTAAEHFCSRLIEQETKLITAVLMTVNVINNLLCVPGWRTKCFLRYNLPTKAWLHFPLSKSVLSIIHEMCFQFFSDPAHHTIHLPQHPSPSMHTSLLVWREYFHVLRCTSDLEGGVAASSHFNFTKTAAPRLEAAKVFISHLLVVWFRMWEREK